MTLLNLLPDSNLILPITVLILGIGLWLYKLAYFTDIPKLANIPEISGAIPFYGHLKVLGDDHASAFEDFGTKNVAPIVQAKLGNRRIVVLNSFEVAQEWIVKNASATIDRPLFYTFHGVISQSQGGTVGTAPWSESTKRRRTAVGTVMTRPAIQKAAPMIDLETSSLVQDMLSAASGVDHDERLEVDPRIFFQRLALNVVLMMCYGFRIADIDDPLLHNILNVAHSVSTFRSTNMNPQDYVPFLRYLPANERSKIAIKDRERRDIWLEELLQKVQTAIDNGEEVSCLSEGLLKDKSSEKLTKEEIKSINVSLVSGGFETVSTTAAAGLGFLSSPEGQDTQKRAYEAIMEVYSSDEEAWEKCISEETVPYVVALVREMLRYYAAIQLLPPRQTMKSFNWRGNMIPKGLSVYMNAQAINHERWLESEGFAPPLPYHYSFGAGSRMCPAVSISNRLLYATFVRLLVQFKITASPSEPPNTHYIEYNREKEGATAMMKPYKILLQQRMNEEKLMKNLAETTAATRK
ncbi:Cytochrome P450 [Glarea lozoyensis ATCC 20868]|uniref:Cytochrome P450 n=1 Tax=Glarea lozoyensis (strain ATCC 20868 / MF5171) TaxID=1116229 RepID=S3E930_GLAL2|nr:Cytochrome P450 [Glarea lozoyensis ATCC 20868]EPE34768.1 Cytochrome P450 [Glarea lozoyensis ATCC 20868]